jgi:hypothetical protein
MAENRNPAAAGDGGSTNGFPSGTTRVELTQADRFRQHALPSIPILANLISAQPPARVWGRRDLSWHNECTTEAGRDVDSLAASTPGFLAENPTLPQAGEDTGDALDLVALGTGAAS